MRNHPTANSTEMVKREMREKDMNKTSMKRTTKKKPTDMERMCDDLGADTIENLHKAFELTAGALYRRAQQRAEAEMQKADQYREK